jgi:hypothetical protein
VIALCVAALSCGESQSTAEIVLWNGKVFTADPARPFVEAVAIRGDRILTVGTSAEVDGLSGSDTRRIDLAGQTAIPGINDAHLHFVANPGGARALAPFSDMDPPWSEVRAAIGAAVRQLPAGTVIRGTVGVRVIEDPAATRFALDSIAPNHPVMLSTWFAHGDLLSTRMMRELAVGETDPDPAGGYYERVRGSNRLNGKIFEYAGWRLWRRLADRADRQELLEQLRGFSDEALRFGITSLQIMPSMSTESFVDLLTEANLPLRVRVIRFPVTDENGRLAAEDADLSQRVASDRIAASGVKWILDGTPLERGMAVRGEYGDRPGWSGRLNFPPDEVASILRESVDRNEPLLLHAVGDRAGEVVFDAMEAMQQVDWPARRLRIEHGDGVVGDLVPRAARLGVIVVQNPTHFALPHIIQPRFGPNATFFRLRSLYEAGVRIAFGSDAAGPGRAINPYLNVLLASVHPTAPLEAIRRELAVEAYTRNAAYAEFKEQEKGTLEPGKLADIAVLSQDIFTVPPNALPATESILTIIGGRVVYDAGRLPGGR